MANDSIKTYVLSVKAGVRYFCPTCAEGRAVWVGETEDGDSLMCCGTCQRIIKRTALASMKKQSVNSEVPRG